MEALKTKRNKMINLSFSKRQFIEVFNFMDKQDRIDI